MIYLKNFYGDEIYSFDLKSMKIEKITNLKQKTNGFIAFEKCGLRNKNRKIKNISIFHIKNKVYLCYNNKVYYMKNITIKEFSLFVRVITIYFKNKVIFICWQWTKNIDEFEINDFFYFLKYSYKQNFKNLLTALGGSIAIVS